MNRKLKGFEFLFHHPLLKKKYGIKNSFGIEKAYEFEFKYRSLTFDIRVPYEPGEIMWECRKNDIVISYNYGYSPTDLIKEFQEILLETKEALHKRDRIRKLFKEN